MALIGGKRRSRKTYKKLRGGSEVWRPDEVALGGGKRRSRKVGRKTRKGTKKGMRRKTARRAYKN